jgi:hypothetical protein
MLVVRKNRFESELTPDVVRQDFERLRHLDAARAASSPTRWDVRTSAPTPHKRHLLLLAPPCGQRLSEFFHWRARVRTASRWHASADEVLRRWVRDPKFLNAAAARVQRAHSGRLAPAKLVAETVRMNSALFTVTHFRASVSKYFAELVGARRVLDFSAGWGDRLTGFMAAPVVRHVTLIDPRASSITACRKQHAFVRSDVTLVTYQEGAETALKRVPARSVDLVLSSPPYVDLERYGTGGADDTGQIRHKVDSSDEYIQVFLRPVVRECARILVDGGTLVVNLDDNERAGVRICQPFLDAVRDTPGLELWGTVGLQKRGGVGVGGQVLAAEPVYVVRKRTARRSK